MLAFSLLLGLAGTPPVTRTEILFAACSAWTKFLNIFTKLYSLFSIPVQNFLTNDLCKCEWLSLRKWNTCMWRALIWPSCVESALKQTINKQTIKIPPCPTPAFQPIKTFSSIQPVSSSYFRSHGCVSFTSFIDKCVVVKSRPRQPEILLSGTRLEKHCAGPYHIWYLASTGLRVYQCISLLTFSLLPVPNRVLMFQVPILVLDLVVRRVVCTLASRRPSPARAMGSTREDSSTAKLFLEIVRVVSVTGRFLQDQVVRPIQTPTWGASECSYSGLYPLTCLAWVALPGDESPASIALRVIETRKNILWAASISWHCEPVSYIFYHQYFLCKCEVRQSADKKNKKSGIIGQDCS